MKIEIGKLLYKIGINKDGKFDATIKKTEASVKKLGTQMSKTGSKFSQLGKNIFSLKNALGAFIAGTLIRGIGNLVKSGAELDSLTQSFNRMANGIGESSNDILNELKRTSDGTISNRDLILSANKAMALGVAENTQEFGELMQIARLKAREFGLSTTQAFNDIVTGVGRGSVMILDNLGIIIKSTEAQEIYAKSLGKTVTQLTEAEKKEALKFAVLKAGNEAVKEAGELNLTYAERIQQVNALQKNFTDRLGQALLPTMESVLGIFGDVNESVEEGDATFNTISKTIYQVVNGFIALGKAAVVVGKSIVAGFSLGFKATKLLIKGFHAVTGSIFNVFQNAKDLGAIFNHIRKGEFSKIGDVIKNRVTKPFAELKDGFKELGDEAVFYSDEVGKSFKSMGESAIKAVDGNGFKSAVDLNAKAMSDYKKTVDDTVEAQTEGKDKTEEWTKAIEKARDEAKKTAETIGDDLVKANKEYSKSILDAMEETENGLADIVIQAETRRAELKKEIRDADDKDTRKALKQELRDVKDVLKAKRDYEDEHATKIEEIRGRLTEAGLDPDALGVGGESTLEENIAEKKRLAGLDEFTRFKELQFAKLDEITNNFITETNLHNSKLEKAKTLETAYTNFLEQQYKTRSELKQMYMRTGDYSTPSNATSSGATTGGSAGNTTTNNISVNNSIGGTMKATSAEELTAVMSFELEKHL